jgi:hypothetical protein
MSVLRRLASKIGERYLWCVFGVELYCDFSHRRYEHHVLRHGCVLIVGESGRVNSGTEVAGVMYRVRSAIEQRGLERDTKQTVGW